MLGMITFRFSSIKISQKANPRHPTVSHDVRSSHTKIPALLDSHIP